MLVESQGKSQFTGKSQTAKLHDVPVILSTVNVSNGVNEDTIPVILRQLCPTLR